VEAAVANVGLAIEAVPEQLELKREIFGTLDRLAPADAAAGSNSSSYPTSQMIGALTHPERVLNTHLLYAASAKCRRTDVMRRDQARTH